jgi:hypothetical protein
VVDRAKAWLCHGADATVVEMLQVRSSYEDSTLRLVLVGTLAADDVLSVNHALTLHLRTQTVVRLILLTLRDAELQSLRVVRYQVAQARAIGIDCRWVAPSADIRQVLETLGDADFISNADTEDLHVADIKAVDMDRGPDRLRGVG